MLRRAPASILQLLATTLPVPPLVLPVPSRLGRPLRRVVLLLRRFALPCPASRPRTVRSADPAAAPAPAVSAVAVPLAGVGLVAAAPPVAAPSVADGADINI